MAPVDLGVQGISQPAGRGFNDPNSGPSFFHLALCMLTRGFQRDVDVSAQEYAAGEALRLQTVRVLVELGADPLIRRKPRKLRGMHDDGRCGWYGREESYKYAYDGTVVPEWEVGYNAIELADDRSELAAFLKEVVAKRKQR